MKRTPALLSLGLAAAALPLALAGAASANDHAAHGRPSSYEIEGDAGGSKFEGIGADPRRGIFYVSEVTGGEIHRGTVDGARTREWLKGDGTDGRYTARGITTDADGNVYVAGGPNGIDTATSKDNGRPDVWVYSKAGTLLAALRMPGDNAFMNDVVIGRDGAAYFTDSNSPQIFRVAKSRGVWKAERWADAGGIIETGPGFNLGGIVMSADRSALVVAQGNTGDLWRFGFDGSVSHIDTRGANLVDADGLVRRGSRLTVVRNFSRMIATLHLSSDGSSARLIAERATDPDRVLTTAKELRGRILYVDSKFDEDPARPPYQVITNPYVS